MFVKWRHKHGKGHLSVFWLQVKAAFVEQIPLGDFGDPVDIAEVVAFLASSRYQQDRFFTISSKVFPLKGPNTSQQPHSMSTGASPSLGQSHLYRQLNKLPLLHNVFQSSPLCPVEAAGPVPDPSLQQPPLLLGRHVEQEVSTPALAPSTLAQAGREGRGPSPRGLRGARGHRRGGRLPCLQQVEGL